jgi:hypothetical protein
VSDPDKRKSTINLANIGNKLVKVFHPAVLVLIWGNFDFSQYGNFDEFINELLGRFGGATPRGGRQTNSQITLTARLQVRQVVLAALTILGFKMQVRVLTRIVKLRSLSLLPKL